jgi:transposase-like protein
MPFEQKYTPETRDASLARVIERRQSEPGNRSIIRETAEQFEVGEQSLRSWIRAWEKANEPAAPEPAPANESATVSTTTAESGTTRRSGGRSAAPAAPTPAAPSAPAPEAADGRIAALEAEVTKLRRDREALKSALAVLLDD